MISGMKIEAEPDSTSDANIMDEEQFWQLQNQAPEITLKSTRIKLKVQKEELPVIGEVKISMSKLTPRC